MDELEQNRLVDRALDYVLPAAVVACGMQLQRVFIPSLAWYLRDTVGLSSISLAPYAFGTFALGFLAAAVRRITGPRLALWITGGGAAAIRLAEQVVDDPAVDLWLSIAGMAVFLMFLPIFMGHLRSRGEGAARRWTYGLILGLALDIALRGVFGALDLSWADGLAPVLIVVAIGGLILWGVWREPEASPVAASDTAWSHTLPVAAIGPWLLLQLLLYQGQGWVEAVSGLSTPLGFVIVMLGSLAAALGAAWGFARRRAVHPALAVAAAIYLPLAVSTAAQPGRMILVTVLIGQMVMGWGWAVLSGFAAPAQRPGLSRTTVSIAGGMVLFLALAFAYYVALDLALPFSRSVIPAAAASLLGLSYVAAALQFRADATPRKWEFSGVSVAALLVLVPLAYWALYGPAPRPQPGPGLPIRVMTYNIHSGFGMAGRQDLEAIAQVIEDSRADIVALQEVSRVRLLDGEADLSAWLARRLDMVVLFRGTEEPIWGNAILSRFPVLESGWGELPRADTLIGRGYLWARIDIGEPQPLTVIATHLHHVEEDSSVRQAQVAVLMDFWNGQPFSLLLGDLNAEPDSEEMKRIAESGWEDSWAEAGSGPGYTYLSADPYQRIDWIWHTPDLMATEVQVPATQASDHLPVLATLGPAP